MSEQRNHPWPVASWTGVGSYPGEDPDEAARTVFGELDLLPHLAELPGRGAGADMIGRSASLLVEMPVEVQPTGWRVARGPGREMARASSFLSYDLEAMERHGHRWEGPFKIQVAGPWTLAASLELRSGERMLGDAGAVGDLTESLVEGVAAHIADVAARLPGASLIVQVDEPSLPAVLAGRVPTASGFRRHRAPDPSTARERLGAVFAAVERAGAVPAAHCCAADAPIGLLHRSGARALGVDVRRLSPDDDEAVGTAVEDGAGLFLGTAAGTGPETSVALGNVEPVRELWNRIGFAPDLLAEAVVVTPACGLAAASPQGARDALDACRTAARILRDEPSR